MIGYDSSVHTDRCLYMCKSQLVQSRIVPRINHLSPHQLIYDIVHRRKTTILEKSRWEGSWWLHEPTARGISRPVSRFRLLRTMQRKGLCLSIQEMPATLQIGLIDWQQHNFSHYLSLSFSRITHATPESRQWWVVFRPPVEAVLTFENNRLAQRIDLGQSLPRLWRGGVKPCWHLQRPVSSSRSIRWGGRCTLNTRKVDIRLPGKETSNSHGARPVY